MHVFMTILFTYLYQRLGPFPIGLLHPTSLHIKCQTGLHMSRLCERGENRHQCLRVILRLVLRKTEKKLSQQ